MNYTKTPYWSIKTPEQYVRYLVNVNKGTDSPVLKNKLIEYAHTLGVSVDPKMTKNEIFEAIIEKSKSESETSKKIAEKFKLGISSLAYQRKFGITNDEVKRMARLGYISKTGEERFRAFNKDCYAPLYNIWEYFELTVDEVKMWLTENPKGTRKPKQIK